MMRSLKLHPQIQLGREFERDVTCATVIAKQGATNPRLRIRRRVITERK